MSESIVNSTVRKNKRGKKMKKIIAAGMALIMTFVMITGCGAKNDTVSKTVNLAVLNGPTGMATVKLLDMEEKYNVTTYQAPTDVVAKVISGEADVAAVPSNLASVLYNKTGGEIVAVSPIALGMLQIVGNNVNLDDVTELKGKTIVASGRGGTPEYVLEKILADNGLTLYEDVQVEWLSNHSEVNSKLLSEEGTLAMIPEPFVSTAIMSGNGKVEDLFDINELWEESTGTELPMGVLIAQREFAEERAEDLKVLLNDLKESVDFVNESPEEAAKTIVEKGFIGNEDIAIAAIPSCHIVLYAGKHAETGTDMLKTFNKILYEMEPESIGGKLPDEDLYYQ